MGDFEKVIVRKPWGYEYLMFENGVVGLWHLYIGKGHRTSLHCHPRKKTGLILLSGEAEIRFLNDTRPLKALDKLIIRPGLFHSTGAVSPEGISLLEIETPCDKTNLVRLDDEYGRQDQPYEGPEAVVPLREDCLLLPSTAEESPRTYRLSGCRLSLERHREPGPLGKRPEDELFVILEGGLYSKSGDVVMGAGDVVTPATVTKLARSFVPSETIFLLAIRKEGEPS